LCIKRVIVVYSSIICFFSKKKKKKTTIGHVAYGTSGHVDTCQTVARVFETRVQRATCINTRGRLNKSIKTRVHVAMYIYYTWPDGRVD
jgi:hypothetical protein